ncbi:MAG: hypothetical protein Q6361_01760 [Candidatus Hermodarchaeota archaeon]|nr:hypothetical protein [Candidatus Hermodarchaeota archaeon]
MSKHDTYLSVLFAGTLIGSTISFGLLDKVIGLLVYYDLHTIR